MTSCHINLKPVTWRQDVTRYPTINVEGPYLEVTCTSDSGLLLSDGYELRDLEVPITIFPGEPDAKKRERLSDGAIGVIVWMPDQAFMHGQFYLKADDYASVWDQVRVGGYAACNIALKSGSTR